MFRLIDVVLTTGLLAGGSDGLHKIVQTITDFMEATSRRIKAGGA